MLSTTKRRSTRRSVAGIVRRPASEIQFTWSSMRSRLRITSRRGIMHTCAAGHAGRATEMLSYLNVWLGRGREGEARTSYTCRTALISSHTDTRPLNQ